MFSFSKRWGYSLAALAIAIALSLGSDRAADLNPKALVFTLPDKIQWSVDPQSGADTAPVVGDVNKPGLYVVLTRWNPHHMSHPHYHVNDRYITVLSGTWWVGTGAKYDPDSTVPLPTGTFVKHFANQIHYDGAKDQPVVLEIVGEGPATSIPAEQK
jgi:hypothetical protein